LEFFLLERNISLRYIWEKIKKREQEKGRISEQNRRNGKDIVKMEVKMSNKLKGEECNGKNRS
jgi:hypothetical protein